MNKLILLSFVFSLNVFANDLGDPLYDKLWHLENNGMAAREEITDIKSNLRPGVPGKDIGWKEVAKSLKLKRRPSVAIIDTGVDYEHEDLVHSIMKNEVECIAGEIPIGEPEHDHDNNGYKGDCMGIDLTTRDKTLKNKPLDDLGHGTHMAGIMAAKWNNGLGVAGVHEDIQILPIKAISANESRQRVPLSTRVAKAILYAVSRNVDAINLSVGYPIARDTQEMRDAVKAARDAGIFLIAAAGNNAHSVPVYPCAYDEVICVGSTRNDGKRSLFSNRGAHVDVYAPGEFIMSTYPSVEIPQFSSIKGYEVKSGTSQAAPIVSAGLALLKAMNPNTSIDALEKQFFASLSPNKDFRLDHLVQKKQNSDIRIKFKDFSVAQLSSGELSAQIPVELIKLSEQVQSSQIRAELLTEGYDLKLMAAGGGQIMLSVTATSLMVPHRVEVKLSVGEQSEVVGVTLSRQISEVTATEKLSISNSSDVKSFGTVPDITGTSLGKYFAEVTRNKEPRGLKLRLWQRLGSQILFVGEKVLEKSTGTLGIYQTDVDADGVDDLMVLALGSYKPTEDAQAVQALHIHYLNVDLTPKFTESGRIEKLGSPIFNFALFGEPRKTRWIYSTLSNGQKILTPVIVESGFVPEADQNKRQRRAGGSLKANHIYVLNVIESEDGGPQFETRIVDNAKFRKAIRKKYRMRFYEDIEPELMLGDSGKVVVRIGQLENSKYLLLENMDGSWESSDLSWPRAMLGYKSSPVIDEDSGGLLTGLFGLISKSRMVMLQLNPEDLNEVAEEVVIDLTDESDHIVRPLLFSRNKLGLNAVFESGQKLYGFHIQNGSVKKSFIKELPRTTFFGELLTQVNAIIKDGLGRPWIYVDDTQINANSIRLQSFDSETGFQTLLRDSFSLDEQCTPLNPARWSQGESFRIQILCKIDGGLELRSLPMQVNTH